MYLYTELYDNYSELEYFVIFILLEPFFELLT